RDDGVLARDLTLGDDDVRSGVAADGDAGGADGVILSVYERDEAYAGRRSAKRRRALVGGDPRHLVRRHVLRLSVRRVVAEAQLLSGDVDLVAAEKRHRIGQQHTVDANAAAISSRANEASGRSHVDDSDRAHDAGAVDRNLDFPPSEPVGAWT